MGDDRRELRHLLGYYLLLGLEFLIAADIIDTLMKPTPQDLLVLGVIIVIRTVINIAQCGVEAGSQDKSTNERERDRSFSADFSPLQLPFTREHSGRHPQFTFSSEAGWKPALLLFMIAAMFLIVAGVYLGCGLLFAIPFAGVA